MDPHIKIGDFAVPNCDGIVAVIDNPPAGVVAGDGIPAPIKGDVRGLEGSPFKVEKLSKKSSSGSM
jgi:hypothetical protein